METYSPLFSGSFKKNKALHPVLVGLDSSILPLLVLVFYGSPPPYLVVSIFMTQPRNWFVSNTRSPTLSGLKRHLQP